MLTEALEHFEPSDEYFQYIAGAGKDKVKGIGKAIVAVGMVAGDIGHKADLLNKKLDSLNSGLNDFNKKSGHLTFWLISWTAIIALATLANVFATAHWLPFNQSFSNPKESACVQQIHYQNSGNINGDYSIVQPAATIKDMPTYKYFGSYEQAIDYCINA